jgi:hypothetical protein
LLEVQILEVAYEKVQISKSKIQEALLLEKELIKEKSKHSEQVELNVDMSKMIQSQEDEPKCLKSKVTKGWYKKLYGLLEEKCEILVKVSLVQK